MSVKVQLTNNTPDGHYRLTFESPRFEDIEDLIESGYGCMVIHFHLWSKWTPWFQRYNLTYRSTRRCRTCGEEQSRIK